jgi:hypothetical protein
LGPRLQDGFKIPRWEPRSRRGIFVGISPLHASNVGLILNPNTNRLSPQFHCVYDDYFETVHHTASTPPPIWEDLVINSRFRNNLEEGVDFDDNWETPVTTAPNELPTLRKQQPAPNELPLFGKQQSPEITPIPVTPRPTSDEIRPSLCKSPTKIATPVQPPLTTEDVPPPRPHEPRRSTRVRKPVD